MAAPGGPADGLVQEGMFDIAVTATGIFYEPSMPEQLSSPAATKAFGGRLLHVKTFSDTELARDKHVRLNRQRV